MCMLDFQILWMTCNWISKPHELNSCHSSCKHENKHKQFTSTYWIVYHNILQLQHQLSYFTIDLASHFLNFLPCFPIRPSMKETPTQEEIGHLDPTLFILESTWAFIPSGGRLSALVDEECCVKSQIIINIILFHW